MFCITIDSFTNHFYSIDFKDSTIFTFCNFLYITKFTTKVKIIVIAIYFSTVKNARTQVLEILHALIDNKNYDERIEFTENGWKKIEYHWYYVTDFGLIGQNQNLYYGDCSRSFIYDKTLVGRKNTFETALRMTEICDDKSITLPLFLFTHLGVLSTPYELAEVPIKALSPSVSTANPSLIRVSTGIYLTSSLKNVAFRYRYLMSGVLPTGTSNVPVKGTR